MLSSRSMFIALGSFAVLLGCSSSTTISVCTPGRSEACTCSDGRTGAQACLPNGTFDVCACTGSDAGAMDDAGGDASAGLDAGRDGGGAPRPGHIVLIGGSLLQPFDAGRRMLVNAIDLSETGGAIRVLEYTEHAELGGWDPRTILRPAITTALTDRGRTADFTELTVFTDLSVRLPNADVLVVYAQTMGDASTLATIATVWHTPLVDFLARGGVIVVLDATGVGGDRGYGYRLIDGMGLLTFAGTPMLLSSGTAIDVVDTSDPVTAGVIDHATPNDVVCFPAIAGGDVLAQTRDTLCPTAVHAVRRGP